MNKASIVFYYLIFSIISMIVNFVTQEVLRVFISDGSLSAISLLGGTAAGFFVKLYLDKTYIFAYVTSSLMHDIKLIMLYTFTGLFTTAIFWFFEYSVYHYTNDINMAYIGGAIGLCIGYFTKYQLDKRFVFVKTSNAME